MALDYTTIPVQFGAILKISQKIKAFNDHAIKSSDSSYNSRLLNVTNGFSDSITVEKRAEAGQNEFFQKDMKTAIRGLWNGYRSQVESFDDFFGVLAAGLGLSDQNAADRRPIGYEYDRQLAVDGTIMLVNRTGVLGNLHKDMLANAQYVNANTLTLGSFTALSGNRGTLSAAAMTALSQMPTGKLSFECVGERVEAPKIAVRLELPLDDPEPDGTTLIKAENLITVEKAFEDYFLGLVSVSLTRPGLTAPTITGDTDDFFTAAGTFIDPKEVDMNGGVLYVTITRRADTGEEWLIEFFSDSSRTNKRGAVVTGTTSGTYSIDIPLIGGTRFAQTFDRAAAAAVLTSAGDSLDTISFDIKTPRVGDKWERTVSNGEDYNFVSKIKRLWRWTPPTAGTTLWTNSAAATVSM